MANFEACFEKTMANEGGFVLHTVPGDRGGMTYAGIARQYHPEWPGWGKIDAKKMDAELTGMVRAFYKREFWDPLRGDDIGAQEAAYHLFDFAVNAGLKTAVRLVQRIVGTVPDGVFGDKTFAAMNNMIQDAKDERIFVLMFSLLKVFRYKNICMSDARRNQDQIKSNMKFLCGWINRVERGIS